MKTLKLTTSDNKSILVNFQNVSHVSPTENGSVIYTVKESGYNVIHVLESIDELLDSLNK